MKKTYRRWKHGASIIAALLMICFFHNHSRGATPDGGYPIASLEVEKGVVLVKPAGGAVLWEEAKDGQGLFTGDTVRTKGQSTALVSFSKKNYIKLFPLTTLTIAEYESEDGYRSIILNMVDGKILAKAELREDKEQIVVKANSGLVRGNDATAFVEAGGSGAGCFDILKGAVHIAASDMPDDEVMISAGQRFTVISGAPVSTEQIEDMPGEDSLENRSCMPMEKPKDPVSEEVETEPSEVSADTQNESEAAVVEEEKTVEETEDGTYVTITVGSSVSFSGASAAGETSPATESVPDVAPPSDLASSVSATDYDDQDETEEAYQAQPLEEEEEEEEEFYSVSITTDVSFKPTETKPADGAETPAETTDAEAVEGSPEEAAGDGPCEEYPEIFDVSVSDEDVDDTGEVILESEFSCDLHSTATIRWSASLECGAITSITLGEVDKASNYFDGGDAGETVYNTYEFTIKDVNSREMLIKVRGDNDKESFFTFTIKMQGQSLAVLPQITDVLVNGQSVEEGDLLEVRSTDCSVMTVSLSGSAYSECGDLKDVSGDLDGSDMTIRGRDTWSAVESFSEDTTFTVVLRAEDETARKSEPFEFEVDLVRGIDPPEVEIESIGGEPVVMFGDPMELFRNNLVDRNLVVAGSAISNHCSIAQVKVGVNEDDPDGMIKAAGTTNWTYGFAPSDGEYEIYAFSVDDTGELSAEMMNGVELIYSYYTLEEKLLMTFKDQMQAYRDKSSDIFMDFTSTQFSHSNNSIASYSKLESSLDDKFFEQSSIYIRYQDSSHSVSGDTGRVFFLWDANQDTSGYSHSATFKYEKTRTGWRLVSVEDDDSFLRHTDEVAYLSAAADKTTMIADRNDTTTITVEVRDSAYNPVKDGTTVTFAHSSNGEIDAMAVTAEGIVDIEYMAGSRRGTVTVTVTSGSFSDIVSIEMEPESAPAPPEGR